MTWLSDVLDSSSVDLRSHNKTGRPSEKSQPAGSEPFVRGSCVSCWNTQGHCKATARNSHNTSEKLSPGVCSAPYILSSLGVFRESQSLRKNPKHTPCVMTPPWTDAAVDFISCQWALIINESTSARDFLETVHVSLITNRADADFTDHWMMRGSDRRASLTADFQDPWDDVERGIWCSLRLSAAAAVSYIFLRTRNLTALVSKWVGTVTLCCVANQKVFWTRLLNSFYSDESHIFTYYTFPQRLLWHCF